jgi:hypothetical protein
LGRGYSIYSSIFEERRIIYLSTIVRILTLGQNYDYGRSTVG